ncbi:hypothetical protein [Chelatococcus sp.]|uniref:hypothetical protein n=1 Tax=Chelatococcus sp. TaxID=1953771 RepID=UPI001ECB55D8|nr:hypothetical protein [Chelatococcus sp.]MBX3545583.1 DUF2190 family protein [Chelatococcus sp.]
MNPLLIKSFAAAAIVAGFRFVKFTANRLEVTLATGSDTHIAGCSDSLGADAGAQLDVMQVGLGEVQLAGTVAAGDPLTADANGKAIKATAHTSNVVHYGGFAQLPGVSGDVIPYIIAPGQLAPTGS